jgi:hypothetical protein
MLGSPSENVDDTYLAARSDELVNARIGFEALDGLGERSGGFRAWHAVVGQEVNSGLPERGEPFGQWMQRDVLGGQRAHGYQHVLSAPDYARFLPEMRTMRKGSVAWRNQDVFALVGHSGTTTTEVIYCKQIRPVITDGAEVMDRLFPRDSPEAGTGAHGCLVTHIEKAMTLAGLSWPVSWSGWPDLNRRPLRPEPRKRSNSGPS